MSENQLFCYSDHYGRNFTDSYQQEPYRVFNVQVTEKEFNIISIPKIELALDPSESYTTRFQTAFIKAWDLLEKEEKQEFLDLPYFDADIFEKITGVDVTGKDSLQVDDIIELNGIKYKRI